MDEHEIFPGADDATEHTPTSLDDLLARLATWHQWGWIYRGMCNADQPPLSYIERLLCAHGIGLVNAKRLENRGLAYFRQRARVHLRDLPHDDDLVGWLALSQHYGAPTRLTDWTYSPFVALFFAYNGLPDAKSPDAAIWMLNAREFRDALSPHEISQVVPDLTGTDPESGFGPREVRITQPVLTQHLINEENQLLRHAIRQELVWPLPLATLRPDSRMIAQQACFVCFGRLTVDGGSSVERLFTQKGLRDALRTILPDHADAHTRDEAGRITGPKYVCQCPRQMVGKLRLPAAWRLDALKALARMNITADVLFPGLDGVGRATALHMVTSAPPLPEYYFHGR